MDSKEILKQEALPDEVLDSASTLRVSQNTLDELGTYLKERLDDLKGSRERSHWEEEKAEAFETYHLQEKERLLPWPGAANLPCILPRIGVDVVHANNMQAIFPKGRALVRAQWNPPGFDATARRAADYLTFVLDHEADFYSVFDDADLKAQMYGIAYMEPYYVKEVSWETSKVTEETNVPEQDPATGAVTLRVKKTTKTEKKKKTTFDGIRIESLPVESVFVSPFMRTIAEAVKKDVVIKTFTLTLDQLMERSKGETPIYKKADVDIIKESAKRKKQNDLTDLEQAKQRIDGFYLDRLVMKETIDLAEAHLWYDIDNDEINEKVTATFHPETGTVIRAVLAPCRIVTLRPRPVDERFYGEGIPKISKPISDEWEAIHNHRVNAGHWENMPFGFYRSGGRFNPRTVQIAPGQFYPVDDPREVTFAQTNRVGSSYFQEEGLLLNYFERLLGISENLQGVQSQHKASATGDIQQSQKAAVRFANPLTREVLAIEELLGHIWNLNRDCAPKEKEYYVAGVGNSPLFKITQDDYTVQLNFRVEIATVFDEQLARDTALLVYKLFSASQTFQMHPGLMYQLETKTLGALNFDLVIPKPPEARTLSPMEEHEMFRNGTDAEPQVGEDAEDHLKQHMAVLQSDKIREWDPEAVGRLAIHIDKTKILLKILKSANLNQSGKFTGKAGPEGKQQGMTASRNPSQHFNSIRVGENGNSARQNASSGVGGPPNG